MTAFIRVNVSKTCNYPLIWCPDQMTMNEHWSCQATFVCLIALMIPPGQKNMIYLNQTSRYYPRLVSIIPLHRSSMDPVCFLHYFFLLLFTLVLSLWSLPSALWLGTSCFLFFDHSICSCRSKSGVNSPSLTRRPARELSISSSTGPLSALLLVTLVTLAALALPLIAPFCPRLLPRGAVMEELVARMRRVMFRTPCFMMSSSSCWDSRTIAVSGNMSMKR